MKKYFGFLPLVLLCCTLQAGRIHLTDGTITYVPDSILIKNDLNADAVVYETIGGLDGYVTGKTFLPKAKDYLVDGAEWVDYLEIRVNGMQYNIKYPRSVYIKNQVFNLAPDSAREQAIYKLSAIISASLIPQEIYTPAEQVIVTDEESRWVFYDNKA